MAYSIEEIKVNERYSILNGAAGIVSQSFIAGFIPLYAIEVLHADNGQIGWISSMPALMNIIAMIPGAIWLNHLTSKKMFTTVNFFFARFALLLIMLVPFLHKVNLAWVLVGLIALMNLPTAFATLSWQSLIGDLVPDDRRATFFSQRSRILTIVGMVATFVAGYGLNFFDKNDPLPFQVMFVLGFLFGILEIYYLLKHREKPLVLERKGKDKKTNFIKRIKAIGALFTNRQYKAFLICAVLFNFGWQMSWPLFTIYQINVAHATAIWLSLFTVTNQIAQILSYKWWGRFSDKYGNSMALFVAALGMMTAPILTVLSTNLIYLTVLNLWTGISLAGTVMLLFNQLLKVSPAEGRTNYIANYNIIIAIIGVVAPQIGVILLEHFGMFNSMTISSILRLIGGISFLYVFLFIERGRPFKKNRKKIAIG